MFSDGAKPATTNQFGYQSFELGGVVFSRDEYYAELSWDGGSHTIEIDQFIRTTQRLHASRFFVGSFLFDEVVGFTNKYGSADMFIGRDHPSFQDTGRVYEVNIPEDEALAGLAAILTDWTPPDFDPFAAPRETTTCVGVKCPGTNALLFQQRRQMTKSFWGLPGQPDAMHPANGDEVNGRFDDVEQTQPQINPEPGFEDELAAFNLISHMACSASTWNPSVCSIVGASAVCMSSEEATLPFWHRNDRLEWFIQLSDEIIWDVQNATDGRARARVIMKAGDIAAMPADIRHKGYSPRRSMLMIWENMSRDLPAKVATGQCPPLSERLAWA